MEKLPSFSWCFDRRGTLATTGVASVEMRVSYMRRCKVMATGVRLGRGEWRDGRVVKRGGRSGAEPDAGADARGRAARAG